MIVRGRRPQIFNLHRLQKLKYRCRMASSARSFKISVEQENNLKYSDTNEEPRFPTPTALPTLIMLSTPSSGALPPINAAKEVCKGQFSRLSSKNGLRVNYWCPSSCPASLFMSHFSVSLWRAAEWTWPWSCSSWNTRNDHSTVKLTSSFERTIYQILK